MRTPGKPFVYLCKAVAFCKPATIAINLTVRCNLGVVPGSLIDLQLVPVSSRVHEHLVRLKRRWALWRLRAPATPFASATLIFHFL